LFSNLPEIVESSTIPPVLDQMLNFISGFQDEAQDGDFIYCSLSDSTDTPWLYPELLNIDPI
jgi:hypothetical protein